MQEEQTAPIVSASEALAGTYDGPVFITEGCM